MILNRILAVLALATLVGAPSALNGAELQKATFAAGCFWCMEALYENIDGVGDVVSGYAGGDSDNPTYRNHGNHAEAVEFSYDPDKVSYEKLLRLFWKSHDPTTNRGVAPDWGKSYRPILFYRSEEEKAEIERVKAIMQKDYDKPIVTEIVPFEKFWKAEDYHQDYVKLHPDDRYVTNVSLPRVRETLEAVKE